MNVDRKESPVLPLLLCVAILPVFVLLLHPVVNFGIIDDWSYIRSAQILAETGHMVYNGWAAAMLGWQLYWGALFLKLFGFSFTAPRVATLLVAMATAALMQRLLVHFGAREWNSAAATLVFLLSPVFTAVTFTFMSDVYGLFVLLACCYGCVRALEASESRTAAAWVCFAALADGIGGTARQTSWLGVLVMVPCTLWLLRRHRAVLLYGGLCNLIGIACCFAALHWFRQQPYSIPEGLLPAEHIGVGTALARFGDFLREVSGELLFLLAPVLLAFVPAIFWRRRAALVVGFILLVTVGLKAAHLVLRGHLPGSWTVPYMSNGVYTSEFNYFQAYLGTLPPLLTPAVRLLLTAVTWTGGIALVCALLFRKPQTATPAPAEPRPALDWKTILILLLPCTAAYMLLLLPRQIAGGILDRYMLFPEFTATVLILRFYETSFRGQFPFGVWVLVAAMGLFDIAGEHDTFALYHAQSSLFQELAAAGVPRDAIDGGLQFNGWTEITETGTLNDPRIIVPRRVYQAVPIIASGDPCHIRYLEFTPVVHAKYVVSLDPKACGGPSALPPVTFHTWFGPHTRTLYAVLGPYAR